MNRRMQKKLIKNINDLIEILEHNPRKGKLVGVVGGILIKEIRYKNYRFYFLWTPLFQHSMGTTIKKANENNI